MDRVCHRTMAAGPLLMCCEYACARVHAPQAMREFEAAATILAAAEKHGFDMSLALSHAALAASRVCIWGFDDPRVLRVTMVGGCGFVRAICQAREHGKAFTFIRRAIGTDPCNPQLLRIAAQVMER